MLQKYSAVSGYKSLIYNDLSSYCPVYLLHANAQYSASKAAKTRYKSQKKNGRWSQVWPHIWARFDRSQIFIGLANCSLLQNGHS